MTRTQEQKPTVEEHVVRFVFVSNDRHLGAVGPFDNEEAAVLWLNLDDWPKNIGGYITTIEAPQDFRVSE